MASQRDEFSQGVKSILAHRAGFHCSKPDCRSLTVGPSTESAQALMNVGVAAHITAASSHGPRYNPALTPEQRGSVENGLWLCQTHAKEVDDDQCQYTVDVLLAWKRHAEENARALLGRPISKHSLEVTIEVTLHRAENNSLIITGSTNAPDGTKLMLDLLQSGSTRILGQALTVVIDGMFAAAGFTNGGQPHSHGWYTVRILAHFNEPWQQPEAVMAVFGRDGAYLAGRYANLLHPELDDSETCLHASFECVAPPVNGIAPPSVTDITTAIQIVQETVLTVDGSMAADPIGVIVTTYMDSPGLRQREGWSGCILPNGLVVVEYSYWDGTKPKVAEWTVVLESRTIRYRNRNAKCMSWSPSY